MNDELTTSAEALALLKEAGGDAPFYRVLDAFFARMLETGNPSASMRLLVNHDGAQAEAKLTLTITGLGPQTVQ